MPNKAATKGDVGVVKIGTAGPNTDPATAVSPPLTSGGYLVLNSDDPIRTHGGGIYILGSIYSDALLFILLTLL